LIELKDNSDRIIEKYNKRMAEDAILEIEFEELNKNKTYLQEQKKEQERQLEEQINNKEINE